MSWLDEVTNEVAKAAGLETEALRLSAPEVREILDLARIASHSSSERINAPLLCYVLGLAVGKGASFDALASAVRASAET